MMLSPKLQEYTTSKRVRIAVVSLILWGTGRFGFHFDAAAVDKVLDLAMALIVSFGATGWGKERSAQEIAAAKTGVQVASVEIKTTLPPPVMTSTPPPTPSSTSPKTPTPANPLSSDLSAASRVLREQAQASKRRGDPQP